MYRISSNFFFQAEDGIRAHCVTGVQTCALPILSPARSGVFLAQARVASDGAIPHPRRRAGLAPTGPPRARTQGEDRSSRRRTREDRKSTRLNSSHTVISYAVFCLKKKKKVKIRNKSRQHIH